MDDKTIESVHRIFDENSVKEQTKLDFWFRKSGGYLRRYHITAKRFQYIILSVLQVKDNAYFLYDGPDTKSRRLKSKGEIYTTAAFQCLIFIFTELYSSILYQNISFVAKSLKNNNIIKLKENQTLIVSYNLHTYCKKALIVCIISVTVPVGYFVNATTLNLTLHGVKDSMCSTGGVAVYEPINVKYSEIATFCQSHSGVHRSRNIYSKGPMLLLVLYSYKEYSKLEVVLELSVTRCTLLLMNVWKYHAFCDHLSYNSRKCSEFINESVQNTTLTINLECNSYGQFTVCDGLDVKMEDSTCATIQINNSLKQIKGISINELCNFRGPRLNLRFEPISRAGSELLILMSGYFNGKNSILFGSLFFVLKIECVLN